MIKFRETSNHDLAVSALLSNDFPGIILEVPNPHAWSFTTGRLTARSQEGYRART